MSQIAWTLADLTKASGGSWGYAQIVDGWMFEFSVSGSGLYSNSEHIYIASSASDYCKLL